MEFKNIKAKSQKERMEKRKEARKIIPCMLCRKQIRIPTYREIYSTHTDNLMATHSTRRTVPLPGVLDTTHQVPQEYRTDTGVVHYRQIR